MSKAGEILNLLELKGEKSSKHPKLLRGAKDLQRQFKLKKVSEFFAIEPLESPLTTSSGRTGGTNLFLRIRDLDEEEILGDVYHTILGLPHPLVTQPSLVDELSQEISKRKEPSFDEVASLIGKFVAKSKKRLT